MDACPLLGKLGTEPGSRVEVYQVGHRWVNTMDSTRTAVVCAESALRTVPELGPRVVPYLAPVQDHGQPPHFFLATAVLSSSCSEQIGLIFCNQGEGVSTSRSGRHVHTGLQ